MTMLHEITAGQRHKRSKRKGRGDASGKGKTAGRGTKGAGAHGGDIHWKRGHEGGQTQIFRRFPKRGFSNDQFERRFHIVNVADLSRFEEGSVVDATALLEAGLIPDSKQPVKILGNGDLGKKLTIVAGWYSKSAFEKIGAAGGTAQNLKGEAFEFPKPKKKFVKREGEAKKGKKPAAAEAAAPAEAPKPAEGEAQKPAEEPKAE